MRYLQKYHIDAVFCKGGYVALPVVFAARFLRIKLVVHESDVHPGLVNRIASRYASAVFTGFDKVLPNAITVGQILSDDIVPAEIASSTSFPRNDDLPVVFIM
ncbi:MAG: glycosyltransferase [Candidatus Peribacteria bacterium]|nr:glycosyltransferase [Candidatus Peribacteria bacterium]